MNIHNDYDNPNHDITLQTIAAVAGNDDDVYHVIMNVYNMANDTIVSISDADKATFSVVTMKLHACVIGPDQLKKIRVVRQFFFHSQNQGKILDFAVFHYKISIM